MAPCLLEGKFILILKLEDMAKIRRGIIKDLGKLWKGNNFEYNWGMIFLGEIVKSHLFFGIVF